MKEKILLIWKHLKHPILPAFLKISKNIFETGSFSGGNRKAQQTENGQPGIMAARNAQKLHCIVHSKSPADPVREQGFF